MVQIAMRAVIICLVAPMLCGTSAQWNWLLLPGDSKEVSLYVDKSRVEKNGTTRQVWQLLDSRKPHNDYMRAQNIFVPYLSLVMLQKIDCSRHSISLLAWTEYTDHSGTGAVVAAHELSPREIQTATVVPGSIGDSVERAVC
jgi:hypothetical protein